MTRVLFVTTSYPSYVGDTSGTFLGLLAEGLVGAGIEVSVVTTGASTTPGVETLSGVRVVRVGGVSKNGSAGGGFIPALRKNPSLILRLPTRLVAMSAEVRRLAAHSDIIHGHWCYPGGFVAVRAGKQLGIPSIVTAHGTDIALAQRWSLLAALVRWTAKHSTLFTTVSEGLRQAAYGIGVPDGTARVLRLGVRPPPEGWHRPTTPSSGQRFRSAFVGSLTRNKQVELLIQAYAKSRLDEWSLTIVGDGPEAESLKQLARDLDLEHEICFTGAVEPSRVGELLTEMDALVLPSRSEGLGLVLVEAGQMGIALAASNIDGPRDVITDGVSGLLFAPDSIDELADVLSRLGADPMLRYELGTAAMRSIDEMGMSVNAMVMRHIALYEELMATTEKS